MERIALRHLPAQTDEMTDLAPRLADALVAADYTYDAVAELLGPLGHAALGRNETTPGLRRTRDGSPLATLTRLFLLQNRVGGTDAERALPGLVDELAAEGLLARTGREVVARLDVRPYATEGRDLWVVSDLTPGLDGAVDGVDPDHVLGISPASTSLAQLTLRHPVGRSLDLGTGCGVQALHLAAHSGVVVATDVNPRALWMTRFNASLNALISTSSPRRPEGTTGVAKIEVRAGSLFDPVAGETFDLIATNPPFVISPATDERLVYRDSGLPGDQVVEDLVRAAPAHLSPGGWCQILANWAITGDRPWDERLGGWVTDDCDLLVVQREVLDPAAYVELWLKDSGHHGGPVHHERYDRWLSWFDDRGIEGIGFGWINLRRGVPAGSTTRMRRELLDWPYDVEQPIAPAIAEWAAAAGVLGTTPDLATTRLTVPADVVQETRGQPGAEDPTTIVLRRQRGLRRARQVDTVEAALVGASDGELTVGQILDALARLLERDPAELRATYLPIVGDLVAEGFLS